MRNRLTNYQYRIEQSRYLQFQFDISFEQSVFGAHANSHSQRFACCFKVVLADLKLGIQEPDLGKSELFVGDELNASLIDLSCPLIVLSIAR